jgi:hypothetical protein
MYIPSTHLLGSTHPLACFMRNLCVNPNSESSLLSNKSCLLRPWEVCGSDDLSMLVRPSLPVAGEAAIRLRLQH